MADSKALATTSQTEDEKPTDPLADIPDVQTFTATSEADRIAGLKLVADSVAQERQFASRAIISNTYSQAAVLCLLAVLASVLVKTNDLADWAVFGTTAAGVIMALLVAVRWTVGPYIERAESVNLGWLGEDSVLITKFGARVIGALVLGFEDGEKKGKKKKSGKGVVRGWTVQLRYRKKGEGRILLEEAVKITKEKGGDGLIFEKDGICKFFNVCNQRVKLIEADSKKTIPKIFSKKFDQRDRKAEKALEHVLEKKWPSAKRK
jgi:hypothetical protein